MKFFGGLPEKEVSMMLSDNAVECYDLDVAKLNKIAERIGPLKSDLAAEQAA